MKVAPYRIRSLATRKEIARRKTISTEQMNSLSGMVSTTRSRKRSLHLVIFWTTPSGGPFGLSATRTRPFSSSRRR